jgi:DNA modification methylase
MKNYELMCGNCLDLMHQSPKQSVALVFGSPPYEDARTYGIDFNLKGQDWVDWMVTVYQESLRVCKGLVAFVVEGRTQQYKYSGTPLLLGADLIRAGITLRKPPIYERYGIFGGGGPDWLRNDYELIICATNGGKLPWSDNTVMGGPPKYGPGGVPTYRKQDGSRINKTTVSGYNGDGSTRTVVKPYIPPKRVNPGNVIRCVVGGGKMGSNLAHENEAPFPESLAEFMVRSFCPPGGVVLDPFCGSGTVGAVCIKTGRKFVGMDVRQSQIDLTRRRILQAEKSVGIFL